MASIYASFTFLSFHLILETLEQKACPLSSMILFCDNSGVDLGELYTHFDLFCGTNIIQLPTS